MPAKDRRPHHYHQYTRIIWNDYLEWSALDFKAESCCFEMAQEGKSSLNGNHMPHELEELRKQLADSKTEVEKLKGELSRQRGNCPKVNFQRIFGYILGPGLNFI